MRELSCDVAVIGAGTAGLHAYKTATDAGADAVIIEAGEGGSTCTRVGCMPSKALIAAGRAAHQARQAGMFGIRLAEPVIDGAAVMRRVRQERDHFTSSVLEDYHAIPAARRLCGHARFAAPGVLLVGEDLRVTARAIIIATGSTPIVPPALEPIAPLVRTNETIFDLDTLPASLGVIGAGPLGLELAQAFARLGVTVTVLDKAEAVGSLVDPEAEQAARAALGAEFAIHTGVEISATPDAGKARLGWKGDSEDEIVVDLVLAASGRKPALDGLNLTVAGVPLDDKGVPRFEETSRRVGDADLFIAGDADGWRPVLHEAARGGRIAGGSAAGGAARRPLPALAIAFTEPNIVAVGARFDALPDGAKVGTAEVGDNGRARIDGHDQGLVRLYADANDKLIGGTIIATGGEHLGQALAMAIDRDVDAATLADEAWYHPTLEEMLQDAARDVDQPAVTGA